MPGLWAPSLLGDVQEAAVRGCALTLMFLSISLTLPLKIKLFLKNSTSHGSNDDTYRPRVGRGRINQWFVHFKGKKEKSFIFYISSIGRWINHLGRHIILHIFLLPHINTTCAKAHGFALMSAPDCHLYLYTQIQETSGLGKPTFKRLEFFPRFFGSKIN